MEFFMKNVYKKSQMTLLFDLMIGTDYHDVTTLKAIDSKTIELTGTARALKMVANSMDECSELVYETDVPVMELQENYITHPIDRFIREKGCSMVLDKSEFTVRFHKLN
jgi:hypothetical protein